MVSYFIQLFIYLTLIIGTPISIWSFYKKKKNSKLMYIKARKKRKLDKLTLKEKFGLVASLIIFLCSSIASIQLIQDLPDALSHHTILYQGNCKISKYNGRGGGSLDAKFLKHDITFENNPYYKAQNGNYYCKIKYLPNSESGITLKLFKSKGGKEVVIK
ncbi:hypothetical protein [Gottfriedia acidiceleris]|uniref:hypothetical protein n=1 Tax=Gottfriedia acidiceleris TaxID=371036 RepID=UPI00101BCE33|nr:hypothetical protein [Gottfriedia acidiceleris]